MGSPFPTSRITMSILLLTAPLLIYGVYVGMMWLANFWGLAPVDTRIIPTHPSTMLYPVLTLFVMGVAYTLLPGFWGYRPSRAVASISIALFLVGEAGALLLYLLGSPAPHPLVLGFLGVLVYASYIASRVRLRYPVFTYADLYILLSIAMLLLVYGYRLWIAFDRGLVFPTGLDSYHLAVILGFAAPMIYGVSVRTMKFKFTVVDNRLLAPSLLLHLAGLAALLLDMTGSRPPSPLAMTLLLGSSTLYALAYNVFEHRPGKPYEDRMSQRDWKRYLYFRRHINMGGAWLLAGHLLLLLYSLGGDRYLWDAGLHSLTLGFIANYIVAYAGVMLPPITVRRAPYKALNPIPLALLNIGVALRVAVDLYQPLRAMQAAHIHAMLIYLAYAAFIATMIMLYKEDT